MIRKIDDLGQTLCKRQGQLFVESINRYKGSSYIFIKTFMESDTAYRIDNSNIFDISEVFEDMNKYSKLNIGKEKISKDVIYWIGYIYRYWSYTYCFNSKKVFSLANSTKMERLYSPYHTMDPSFAIERIMEDSNYDVIKDDSINRLMRIYGIDNKKV